MKIHFDFMFFIYEIGVAFTYIPIVALLSVVPLLAGSLIGGGMAFSRVYKIRGISQFSQGYIVVMRSIPILLQMLLLYFVVKGIFSAFGLDAARVSKLVVVLLACTLIAAGYLAEGIRSALSSVETGQYEAGYSVGMNRLQVAWYIVIPQSLPVAVPIIGSIFIGIIKASSAAYLLGVVEMIQGTAMNTAGNFRYLEAYCAAAVVYWLITICVERITVFAEKRVRRNMKGGVS
jgi:L-cystine transport system permease protein